MKPNLVFLFTFGSLFSAAVAQDQPDLANHDQKVNYAFGMDIVSTFKQQEFDIDLKSFVAGMEDSLAGKPVLTADQQKGAIKELSDYFQVKEKSRRDLAAIKNLKAGQEFLAANAQAEGVQTKAVVAPDGSKSELQYKILKSGPAGTSPKKTDVVEVHYAGTRLDGTEFDSSVKRGIPATFKLTDVIPGWTEALQMMKAGDKWQLFVPANLAYGEFGPPQIEPNSTLIFEVELLSFYSPEKTNASTNASATSAH